MITMNGSKLPFSTLTYKNQHGEGYIFPFYKEWWEEDIFLVADTLLLARYFQNIIYMLRNNFSNIILPSASDKGISLLVKSFILTA